MQDLIKQEIFELEILEYLKNRKLLKDLIFIGGTMLRLCYDLPRYSVDLDFWFKKKVEFNKFFLKVRNALAQKYIITDSENKFYTLLFEIKSESYPRKLKIEIRKKVINSGYELKIAFSKYSNIQVLVDCLDLETTIQNKIETLIERKEIRDCFDIEFLIRKGVRIDTSKNNLVKVKQIIEKFKPVDYKVKLGSILEPELRKYYEKNNFKFLITKINELLNKNEIPQRKL
ncbi:MAG: nucleotidyl transferase AbiEii/AbiGii toxin family protein [candidate division WOR-3 bacterium]